MSASRQTYLWDFPCQGLNGRGSATSKPGDGEFDALPGGVQAHSELGLAPCVGDADQVPTSGRPFRSPVAERDDEAELFRKTLAHSTPIRNSNIISDNFPQFYLFSIQLTSLA